MQDRRPRFAYPVMMTKLGSMVRTRSTGMQSAGWPRCGAALLGFLSTIATASPQPGLETLFYTPLERQKMFRVRTWQVVPGSGSDADADTSFAKLSGVVRRAAGKGTVWINGTPVPEGTSKAGKLRGVDAMVDGRQLRVGESIDKSSGVRSDVVQPGAVTVQKRP